MEQYECKTVKLIKNRIKDLKLIRDRKPKQSYYYWHIGPNLELNEKLIEGLKPGMTVAITAAPRKTKKKEKKCRNCYLVIDGLLSIILSLNVIYLLSVCCQFVDKIYLT